MDCYAVGPTLGCGTAALMAGDTIIYPYCYRTQEILDNGPLRFTVKLEFNPLTVRGDSNVVETRVITLDAGSYLNKTVVSYTNLKEAMAVTTGIVLREPDGVVTADAANGYITYVDPTTDRSGGNGKIFIGAAFPSLVKEAKTVLFPERRRRSCAVELTVMYWQSASMNRARNILITGVLPGIRLLSRRLMRGMRIWLSMRRRCVHR